MPEMDGFEVLKNLKNDSNLQKIPVLVISSRISQGEKEKARAMGADAFLAKPFTSEGIISKVRNLLRANNILQEATIWDLNDIMHNPWLKKNYDMTYLIHEENGQLCDVQGEKIVDLKQDYKDLDEPELEIVYQKFSKSEEYHETLIDDSGRIWDLQKMELGDQSYVLCFRKDISTATYLAKTKNDL